MPWWTPDQHLRRRPYLLARARITDALRHWFKTEDFLEVEAAALQVSPGNETHLHAFSTIWQSQNGQMSRFFLHTSPEFACKKLLAAGERRICSFSRVFRNRERSALHHPEFMMLEWYRAQAPYTALMADCGDILRHAAKAAGVSQFQWRESRADPFAAPQLLHVTEAFAEFAGIDLIDFLPRTGPADPMRFADAARQCQVRVSPDDTWSDIFSKIMTEKIEPRLGLGRATILLDYPVSEAALARRKPDDPRFCERFELYVCGIELANGFGELTDPIEQRRRFEEDMTEKARIYGESYPIDEDFIDALAIMPASSGIALGLDRLVMLATGAATIEDVIWTPMDMREEGRA